MCHPAHLDDADQHREQRGLHVEEAQPCRPPLEVRREGVCEAENFEEHADGVRPEEQ
eukprot:CAMPEP_0177335902 /NCGR_PEP_ID=MMETSP0368-20130122/23504_1 /TAXON_ID=447022 ORGANISM="Scrippsiella hangoei-like, Strain SHHI-4" /NCGR_SAMPLE_ID=MMETSP0368 /ASSEMBLY_ACC=CAM_ASM_000363 /LENGTH=56 /DNA_ID=CAMNT_0018796727 /DNA_START=346 /DNA_END=516 /DNA_ORIENTATION=+